MPLSNTVWYSAIDCDSACVWDKSCIIDFGKPELTGITGNEDEEREELKNILEKYLS